MSQVRTVHDINIRAKMGGLKNGRHLNLRDRPYSLKVDDPETSNWAVK